MGQMRFYYRSCRFLCQWGCTLYLKTRVYGRHHVPEAGGVLLVCNHQSFVDPVLVTMALHREGNYMARDTLFRHPLFGRLIQSLNAFPVKRGTADLGAVKEAMRRLKQGKVVVVFPEGTRTPDGRIGPMLPGLGAIAQKTRVPVVPTLIEGVFQAWPRHSPVPQPGNVVIEYGRPLQPADYRGWPAERLLDEVRRRLVDMQSRWHGRIPERQLEWYRSQQETA